MEQQFCNSIYENRVTTANTRQFCKGVSIADNRPIACLQRKLYQQITKPPIQRKINIGWVPTTPGNYRHYTDTRGCNANTNGGQPFYDSHRNSVMANNIVKSGGNVPFNMEGLHPASDITPDRALLTYELGRDYTPELDHIVMKSENGANDLENARLISKGENNDLAVNRPHAPSDEVKLRIYTSLSIVDTPDGAGVGSISCGDDLSEDQVRALVLYATNQNIDEVGEVTKAHIDGIKLVNPGISSGVELR